MKQKILSLLLLSALTPVAHAYYWRDIGLFSTDISGTASYSTSLAASGTLSFGPVDGTTGNNAGIVVASAHSAFNDWVDPWAEGDSNTSGISADAMVYSSLDTASASATWSGKLVNTTLEAKPITLDFDTRPSGDAAAKLSVNGQTWTFDAWGDNIISLGMLAPGSSFEVSFSAAAKASGPTPDRAFSSVLVIPKIDDGTLAPPPPPIQPVPEPGSAVLMLLGLGGLAALRRRYANAA